MTTTQAPPDIKRTLDVSAAKGAYTGQRYVESLRDGREVWLNGEKVKDVTTHPAFAGAIREFCRLYDLQHSPALRDQMTLVSPETGNRVSYSWLVPRTPDDLRAKWHNSEIWMEQSWGQLGRTPDFMAGVLVGWHHIQDQLNRVNPMFGENVVHFHRYAMENDLSLTHAIGDPQINRADVFRGPVEDPDMALRVVRESSEGIVIRGAKQLATLAPISNEIMVYLSATFSRRAKDEFVQWFSIPMNAPGLKILCREPLSLSVTGHSLPLASRFDEQDAMVFFDDVLIPWERVFMLYDREAAVRLMGAAMVMGGLNSSAIRFYSRLQTYVGVTTMIAEAIGVDGFPEVREKLGELVMYSEICRLAMNSIKAEAEDRLGKGGGRPQPGTFVPGLFTYAAQISGRVAQILREIGGSGLIMQPSEADLANPELRPYLERYMRGADVSVDYKSRLMRLGFDLTISSFANRQELYEYWHGGDPTRNRTNIYLRHDRSRVVDRLRRLISEPESDFGVDQTG